MKMLIKKQLFLRLHRALRIAILLSILLSFAGVFFTASARASDSSPVDEMAEEPMGSRQAMPLGKADCGTMEIWDYPTAMCMPRAMPGMKMRMLMAHGNGFLTETVEEGKRGQNALTLPDMFMVDIGSSLGDHHYLNLNFMGTAERWTYPTAGYPEFLQIGERNTNGVPFLDHQHPHNSPIMGLTLSDTVSIGDDHDSVKFFFAPRGSSTDGPVPFMHRLTGMINPDAPLGHHIGQDVGHISSTVAGAALNIQSTVLEISSFNGTEPEPESVDLHIGRLNSFATRLTQEFSTDLYGMISAAYVKSPEADQPELDHVWRYSASIYAHHAHKNGWAVDQAFIYGLIKNYDHTSALTSLADEWWVRKDRKNFWGRLEVLQRTAGELQITSAEPNQARWVTALTLGYTHKIVKWESAELGLGGSITKDFVPHNFESAYGGDPLAAKIFIQATGMGMWNF